MHGSALGAAKGEGRSAAASSAVLWSVRSLGPARPDYRIASERSENPGSVGLVPSSSQLSAKATSHPKAHWTELDSSHGELG
ncbi:hypothetical protein NQZ68_009088 [Dissostichus eleginoides]|nr:hypothetical protein NQZ68_009088 [Dissostichus eleginoides]